MPFPILKSGQASSTRRSTRDGKQWPAFPGIPIFLEAHDERKTTKTYGTTPTTPTTPEVLTHCRLAPSKHTHLIAPKISPVPTSPTTTIQTSSNRSSVWPIPEPPPEIQHQEPRRPTLHFFPTQRPRTQLEGLPTLQIPHFNEKTPINPNDPGLGITHGLPKPPSIEVTSPINERPDASFNIAQRIEEKLWRYSASGSTLKRWFLEILSWLFSAVCMGAVIGVLIYLEGESLSKWTLEEKTHLTLNTYISILSKMAGAALILPVSEALGQLKWSWFLEHSKQMWDFEIFDNASRGPWGSMLLLLRTKGRALAAVGAMIMLGSLALDPFFQQVVDFPERWALRNNLTGEIPRIARYEPVLTKEFTQHREAGVYDKDLYPIVKEFFYGNGTLPVAFGNGTRPDIPLSCPTSNCTWPEYETLAICSRCEDASAALDITYACMETTVDWSANWTGPITEEPYPNATVCGHFLNATSNKPVLLSGYIASNETNTPGEALMMRAVPLTDFDTKEPLYGEGSVLFKNVRYPLLDALIASAPDGLESVYHHKLPTVHECILSWCVQTVSSSYEFGLYTENVTSEYWDTSSEPVAWPWQSFQVDIDTVNLIYGQNITLQPSRSHTQHLDTAAKNALYTVGNVTIYNAMVIFDDFFPSTYTSAEASAVPLLRYKNYFNGPYTRTMTFNPWNAPNNLTRHMERLAASMTNVIRSSSTKQMFHGEAFSRENFVQVRWQWLTLPLGLLLISLVFLAATIAKSAAERDRVGVWKTSAYATLLYGLPDEMQNKITRSGSTGTPRSKAKELKVKLQPNGGWRVSGNLFTPFTPKSRPNQPPPGWI
ncbi:uncharacterized protein EKO05_0005935 [Ascochyta rabiei]|uniref:Uncharacterized protein n=1 Tax=Didymella rabiei TaxID=5454 RepID=A0A163M9J2_DIDRA|nr:uncharacterized protein EKO05_0005935 [Ascochyta rabiei]KZM28520.1 hypothetical protein ST47_g312 [Ascochyta rabiei]UPX15489.1 hypothetical protein EKO05_0005935 [Ascochyta rabiei]